MPLTKRAKWGWALAAVACPVVMLWGMWRTFIGEPVVEVMQRVDGPGWNATLLRVNYHSTVAFVYEVKVCEPEGRCKVVFKGQRASESRLKLTRISDRRIRISSGGAMIILYSNFFDYSFEPPSRLTIELDSD